MSLDPFEPAVVHGIEDHALYADGAAALFLALRVGLDGPQVFQVCRVDQGQVLGHGRASGGDGGLAFSGHWFFFLFRPAASILGDLSLVRASLADNASDDATLSDNHRNGVAWEQQHRLAAFVALPLNAAVAVYDVFLHVISS
jgi:hypothetical protein